MKKTLTLLTIAAVVGTGSYLVFARGQMGGMMGGRTQRGGMMDSNSMMMQRGMMGQGGMMMGGGMMGMHPMSSMMYGSSLAATSDGGALVLTGNKLIKYDKNLNLVKEVEIKIDWENIRNMMMQHQNMMMGEQKKTQ